MYENIFFPTPLVAELQVTYLPKYPRNVNKLNKSSDTADFLKSVYNPNTVELVESMYCIYLNRGNLIIGVAEISKGGITGTVADPRIVLGIALTCAATAIILSHNHPSHNLKPSKADELITAKIKQAAALFDIILIDHIIFTPSGYYSFADEGIL